MEWGGGWCWSAILSPLTVTSRAGLVNHAGGGRVLWQHTGGHVGVMKRGGGGREKEGSREERRGTGESGREEEEGGDCEDKGTLPFVPQMLPEGGGRRLGEGYRLGLEFE